MRWRSRNCESTPTSSIRTQQQRTLETPLSPPCAGGSKRVSRCARCASAPNGNNAFHARPCRRPATCGLRSGGTPSSPCQSWLRPPAPKRRLSGTNSRCQSCGAYRCLRHRRWRCAHLRRYNFSKNVISPRNVLDYVTEELTFEHRMFEHRMFGAVRASADVAATAQRYTYICIYIHTSTHVCAYVHDCIYAALRTPPQTLLPQRNTAHTYIHIYILTDMCACTYINAYICVYIHTISIYIHIHIYLCTHVLTNKWSTLRMLQWRSTLRMLQRCSTHTYLGCCNGAWVQMPFESHAPTKRVVGLLVYTHTYIHTYVECCNGAAVQVLWNLILPRYTYPIFTQYIHMFAGIHM